MEIACYFIFEFLQHHPYSESNRNVSDVDFFSLSSSGDFFCLHLPLLLMPAVGTHLCSVCEAHELSWSTLFDPLFLSTLSFYISGLMLKKKEDLVPVEIIQSYRGLFEIHGTELCF